MLPILELLIKQAPVSGAQESNIIFTGIVIEF